MTADRLNKYQVTVATLRDGLVSHVISATDVNAAKDRALRAHPGGMIGEVRRFGGEE